jgi:protoheme IX farnesyltransferase
MFKKYYQLTKPGIIYGNLMTATAGFLLASRHQYDLLLLIETLAGTSLIIASGCVFNNYMDRGIDAKMARTKKRALVQETIPVFNALLFGSILGLLGFCILSIFTSTLVFYIGLIGFVDYVFIYGYFKRRSIHGTMVGGISGATPLLAGYCAASGHFGVLALMLFIIMAIWQMPHFYAIGTYRQKDYAKAGLPILPVVKGIAVAKKYILAYILLYIIAVSSLTVLGYAGYVYLAAMLIISGCWLRYAILGFKSTDDNKYGHQIFGYSLLTLMVFSLMISIDRFLP